MNIEDGEPCVRDVDPCSADAGVDPSEQPLSDWDEDEFVNIEDPEPCDAQIPDGATSCLPVFDPAVAVDTSLDSDGDGVPNAEDVEPCNPASSSGGDGEGLPLMPWVPAVGAVVVLGGGALVVKNRGDGPEDDEPKEAPKASIKIADVS